MERVDKKREYSPMKTRKKGGSALNKKWETRRDYGSRSILIYSWLESIRSGHSSCFGDIFKQHGLKYVSQLQLLDSSTLQRLQSDIKQSKYLKASHRSAVLQAIRDAVTSGGAPPQDGTDDESKSIDALPSLQSTTTQLNAAYNNESSSNLEICRVILGINENEVTVSSINKAYRKTIKKVHVDKNQYLGALEQTRKT